MLLHVLCFEPDKKIHPDFTRVLKEARDKGVHVLAYDTIGTPNSIELNEAVEVGVFKPEF